jgi:NitT/TauT family transport system substrate-binding protein
MRRYVLLIIVVVALTIGAALYLFSGQLTRRPQPNSSGFHVRVSYLPVAPDLPFFVAMDQGFFREQGLDIEPIEKTKSDEALELLFTGRVEATAIMELYSLLSHEQVRPGEFKIYLMAAAEENTKVHQIIVRKDSEISSLAELKGKKLGHFPGPQLRVFNILILKNFMPDPGTQVTLVNLAPDVQIAALENKSVDAIFALEPIGTQAVEAGVAKALSINPLYQYVQRPFPASASAISGTFIATHPIEAQSIVNATNKAIDFIESHPTEARQSLVKWTHVTPDIASRVEIYRYWSLPRINKDAVQRFAQLLADNKVLDKAPDTSGIYYESK